MTRRPDSGFTLVELAIALMVIGLLIAGVLKGQELVENARITQTLRMMKEYDAAAVSFLSIYNGLPGDMRNPGSRLPNCTTAKCILSGNGNSLIGANNFYLDEENNVFWLHLYAAGLVSGIDPNSTWVVTSDYTGLSLPVAPGGGKILASAISLSPIALYPDGFSGNYWIMTGMSPAAMIESTGFNSGMLGRMDAKADDSQPWQGQMTLVYLTCGIDSGDTDYQKAGGEACGAHFKAEF